jgi:hypothetical protein
MKIELLLLKATDSYNRGRDSSVGIATGYGLGIESRWGRDFSHTSRPALGPTQPPGYWVVPGGKRPGRDADHTHHF